MHQTFSPGYYRARIAVIRECISQSDPTSTTLVLLRNGVIQDKELEKCLIHQKLKQQSFPDTPLSLLELCSFNTWFMMHPGKVCGEEIITTSIQFPITLKGDRKNIETVIGKTLADHSAIPTPHNLEMEALALEIELHHHPL
jgi:hypothetical protein